jgi:uncharacterized glyoxalase superfamily protein PhnB
MAIEIKRLTPLLQVFDMPRSIHFYRDVIGFEMITSSAPEQGDDCDWVLLRMQGTELMLNTAYEKQDRPSAPDEVRMAGHSDTTIYFGCPDVDAAYAHFVSKGMDIQAPYITGYGFKAIDIKDPDDYGLCFHWPSE